MLSGASSAVFSSSWLDGDVTPLRSEIEFGGELGLAAGGSRGNLTEGLRVSVGYSVGGRVERGSVDAAGRVEELGVIEDVVTLHAELEGAGPILRDGEVFSEDQVGVVDSRSVIPIAALVSECADRLRNEAGGLEVNDTIGGCPGRRYEF